MTETTSTTSTHFTDLPPAPEPPAYRRLLRSRSDRKLTGVCGGLAEYLSVDPTIVRVGVVLATLFTGGFVALAYLIAAVLIPEE